MRSVEQRNLLWLSSVLWLSGALWLSVVLAACGGGGRGDGVGGGGGGAGSDGGSIEAGLLLTIDGAELHRSIDTFSADEGHLFLTLSVEVSNQSHDPLLLTLPLFTVQTTPGHELNAHVLSTGPCDMESTLVPAAHASCELVFRIATDEPFPTLLIYTASNGSGLRSTAPVPDVKRPPSYCEVIAPFSTGTTDCTDCLAQVFEACAGPVSTGCRQVEIDCLNYYFGSCEAQEQCIVFDKCIEAWQDTTRCAQTSCAAYCNQ